MISCCTPLASHAEETLNTLSYASTAIGIKSEPQIILDPQDRLIVDLKQTISKLREENQHLTATLSRIRVNSGIESASEDSSRNHNLFPAQTNSFREQENILTLVCLQLSNTQHAGLSLCKHNILSFYHHMFYNRKHFEYETSNLELSSALKTFKCPSIQFYC